MMSKISRLFDSLREPSSQAPEKYQLGEVPMFAGRTHHRNSTLIVIISLYCAVCAQLGLMPVVEEVSGS